MSTTTFLSYLQTRYNVGPRYAQLYIDTWFGVKANDTAFVRRALRQPPVSIWFDYAMTTNQRGEEFRRRITPYLPQNAQRFLDVGCGNGGFLVAMAKSNLEVMGIEINPQLIPYAQANFQDNGLDNSVIQGDILDPGLVSRLGTFDLINCNDVIEHVLDAPQAMLHMVSLLNPGGCLVMKIPNKLSLNFVARDGHFNLFAITLLERVDAVRYHGHYFKTGYDVGEYYELNYYTQSLNRLGCQASVLPFPVPRSLWKIIPLLGKAWLCNVDFNRNKTPHLPGELSRMILQNYHHYHKELVDDLFELTLHPTRSRQIRQKYLADFWTILARKGRI